jgi:hypothetical protein
MSDNPVARWNANNPHGQKFPKQQIYSQADMDEAKATARAEGYRAGVQDVLNILPPDNGKGGDA